MCNDPAIAALLTLRNVQYHRWRGESAGVTGIPRGAPSAADLLASGQVVAFGRDLLPPYVEGSDTLDELTRVSRDALDALIARMESFLLVWWEAFDRAFGAR
jgi:hypothetical protein